MDIDAKDDKTKPMLYHAYRCLFFNEMLINNPSPWISAEEGNENMIEEFRKSKNNYKQ